MDELLVDARPFVGWVERQRPEAADLLKRRLFLVANEASACANLDIPEYAKGKVEAVESGDTPSDGARRTAELLVVAKLFEQELREWADDIEGDQPDRWSKPDSPTRWATKFSCSARTFKEWVKDKKIRAKNLSDRSYQVHVDDLPTGS